MAGRTHSHDGPALSAVGLEPFQLIAAGVQPPGEHQQDIGLFDGGQGLMVVLGAVDDEVRVYGVLPLHVVAEDGQRPLGLVLEGAR